MYHALIRRRLRHVFALLSAGNFEPVVAKFAPAFEHTFSGNHPLGGTRRSADAVRQWFARLYRLFPSLSFEIKAIVVSGWPWDTRAAVEWIDRATPADGVPYVNEGMHSVRIRWGRVVRLRAYLDTSIVEETCRRLARAGVTEAAAPPIT